MSKKSKSELGLPKVKHLDTKDYFCTSTGWRINKRRYKSFKKACQLRGITMLSVVNDFLDSQIKEVLGDWYLNKMLEDIDYDLQHSPARPVGRPKKTKDPE